jgi:cystathionine beta-lyase
MLFDQIIDRTAHQALKWERYKDKDILPMWIADMDFRCAPPIIDGITSLAQHGVYGYVAPNDYLPAKLAIKRWLHNEHQWNIELDWIVWTPGVVPAFNLACQAYCEAGDNVMVQTPNYPPMLAAPGLNKMNKLEIGLVPSQNDLTGEQRATIDLEQLASHAADPKTKLFILCNPMNPAGTVLTRDELIQIEKICHDNDVLICSDEIHCDLVLDETAKHIPIGSISETSITLMAASKTFNVAGFATSFAIIPDGKVRRRFVQQILGVTPWVTHMGLVATEKAFTECDQWHKSLIDYLRTNRNYLFQQVNRLPGLRMARPQATYLAWVDASGLGIENPHSYYEQKGVGFSPGFDFGNKQYIRINYGCPKHYLDLAIEKMRDN